MPKCKIKGCENKYRTAGFCNAHYLRNYRHGDPNIKKSKWNEKLDYKVSESNCFEVTSHKPGNHGYPLIMHKKKCLPAHRKIYEEMFGEIPKGQLVRHKCDNRLCINPEHLELGTFKDNMNDKVKRGRQAKGEQNARSKLKEYQVIEIKRILKQGSSLKHNAKLLSEKYGVAVATINDIYYGNTWKHIGDS